MNRALRYATVGAIAVSPARRRLGRGLRRAAGPAHVRADRRYRSGRRLLTAKASATTVKAWEQFRITGVAKGIKAGTKLTVQQKQGTKWVSLPAQTPVNSSGAYAVRVKLGLKGVNQLRMATGSTVSPVVSVTVR